MLPYAYGSIHKIGGKGKRTRPWRVRISNGHKFDEEKQKYVRKYLTIGYFSTKKEAIEELALYNNRHYSISKSNLTFDNVYEEFIVEYEKTRSKSTCRTVKAAYRYFQGIGNIKMKELRIPLLKKVINDAYVLETKYEIVY